GPGAALEGEVIGASPGNEDLLFTVEESAGETGEAAHGAGGRLLRRIVPERKGQGKRAKGQGKKMGGKGPIRPIGPIGPIMCLSPPPPSGLNFFVFRFSFFIFHFFLATSVRWAPKNPGAPLASGPSGARLPGQTFLHTRCRGGTTSEQNSFSAARPQ